MEPATRHCCASRSRQWRSRSSSQRPVGEAGDPSGGSGGTPCARCCTSSSRPVETPRGARRVHSLGDTGSFGSVPRHRRTDHPVRRGTIRRTASLCACPGGSRHFVDGCAGVVRIRKDDDAPAVSGDDPPSGIANPPSCESVLNDPFFEGEGQVTVGVTPGGSKRVTCSIELRGDSKVLKKLGIKSLCEFPEASVAVAITVDVEQRTGPTTEQERNSWTTASASPSKKANPPSSRRGNLAR